MGVRCWLWRCGRIEAAAAMGCGCVQACRLLASSWQRQVVGTMECRAW